MLKEVVCGILFTTPLGLAALIGLVSGMVPAWMTSRYKPSDGSAGRGQEGNMDRGGERRRREASTGFESRAIHHPGDGF